MRRPFDDFPLDEQLTFTELCAAVTYYLRDRNPAEVAATLRRMATMLEGGLADVN